MRAFRMQSLAHALPALPGLDGPKTYAPWPVWSGSTTAEVKFQPLPKKEAVRRYHDARRFERSTRQPGRQDGAIGRNGLAVLHALLFDFLNYSTGRLDPSYAKIAEKACISVRSVARGLAALKQAGLLHWQQRSRKEQEVLGGYRQVQETNAYGVLPPSQWRGFGFWRRAEPPTPERGTWGDHPPLPGQLDQAAADRAAGDSERSVLARLADDPGDTVACAVARFFKPIFEAKS